MDCVGFLLVVSTIRAFIYVFTSLAVRRQKSLPPGPRPLPIIGNIFHLGNNPHQALAHLSKTYGPVMTLKLGSITTIVISSPDLAKEALHTHDLTLSSRTIPDAVHVHAHESISIVWQPIVAHWRYLRKLTATQMFAGQKLDAGQALRRQKVRDLLEYVHENCNNGRAIDIGRAAFTTVLNIISNTLFSIDLASYASTMSQEFNDLAISIMTEAGRPNMADYFPILRLVDPQGIRKRMKIYFERLLEVFDGIIKDRTEQRSRSSSSTSLDVLDSLLLLAKECDNNSEFSLDDMKHLLVDLFIAGTDTTGRTVEWAMAELLHNPEKLAKLKTELKQVKGEVEEADIMKLPYLQATIKETLRIHPPAPLLVPHKAESEVEIHGFKIPKNSQILVNVWAVGRDENIWKDPERFEPERFYESKIDVKGKDFELIPFGAGRRICPGLPLAYRTLHLILASLIQSYEWKIAEGVQPPDLDMCECFGLTLHKAKPLLVIPSATVAYRSA